MVACGIGNTSFIFYSAAPAKAVYHIASREVVNPCRSKTWRIATQSHGKCVAFDSISHRKTNEKEKSRQIIAAF
jgi:hypothetical protein